MMHSLKSFEAVQSALSSDAVTQMVMLVLIFVGTLLIGTGSLLCLVYREIENDLPLRQNHHPHGAAHH
jgi:hypothetical protein